jgi:mannitol 2-dehydrogenase
LWCRYCAGTSDSGKIIPPNDTNWGRLQSAALEAKVDPMKFLEMRDIFGEVGESPIFRERFALSLKALWADGTAATLRRYLDNAL